ncbi:MAG: TIGR04211 family SH3 domain-containing protein [Methylococcales bacterium]|nr:TIGR04211 family SH3 domain-containing protein [Methylococcales bacterium]
MKKTFNYFFILICLSSVVNAKSVYVTDNMKYTLRSTESTRGKILKMMPSGTALTLVEENKDSGYSKVETRDGVEGYILTRHTLNRPISRWYLNKANKKLAALQSAYNKIDLELTQLKNNNNKTLSSNSTLSKERNKLSKDLNELRRTAANAVQLKHDRDQSRIDFIDLNNNFKKISLENQMLKNSATQDWFLYGGILSLFGVILGFILPKLSWRRKASNWDTF